METKKCIECGVEFCKKINVSKKNWLTTKFCSVFCSNKNRIGKHFSPNSQFKKGRIYTQEERDKLKGHTPWNKGVKYSEEMKSRLNLSGLVKGLGYFKGKKRLDITGENNPKWVEKIKKSCSHCKKILLLPPNEVRNRNFCDRVCWALGTRGKNSPVFKGEKSVARFRNRVAELPEYKQWHADVMKRDGHKCVMCGCVHSKERPLEVDHKKRFLLIVNENAIITPEDARNCKELWDVDNGQTVCRICHRTLDTYGTKGLRKYSV